MRSRALEEDLHNELQITNGFT